MDHTLVTSAWKRDVGGLKICHMSADLFLNKDLFIFADGEGGGGGGGEGHKIGHFSGHHKCM